MIEEPNRLVGLFPVRGLIPDSSTTANLRQSVSVVQQFLTSTVNFGDVILQTFLIVEYMLTFFTRERLDFRMNSHVKFQTSGIF